jgi:hypothetical protein
VTGERGWASAQHAVTAAHQARSGTARRRVKVQWWTAAAARGPDVTGVVTRLWSGRRSRARTGETFVALYEPEDPVGAPPFLVVRAGPGDLASSSGRALATVHGEPVPGGALVIETRAGTVVPVEPPSEAGDRAPGWTEVDEP